MSGFLGLRSTNDWVQDQRPKNWRETILYLWPNGKAPLTALTAIMASEKTDDPEFYWWSKKLPDMRATVTGVYTDSALTTAYVSGATAGTKLYFKMSANDVKNFRVGMQVIARVSSDLSVDVNGKVTARAENGANSYVEVTLLEDDDNSTTKDLSDTDVLLVVSSISEEGGETPESLLYDPTKFRNYTQIVRTSLKLTRTARKTRLRTGDSYKEAKRECLEIHSVMLEKMWLFSIPTENTGTGGEPERTTGGVFYWGRQYAPQNVKDYKVDKTGTTWLSGGDDWIDEALEQYFRYATDPIGFAGSGAVLGLQKLAKNKGTMYFEPEADFGYGLKVNGLVSSFGEVPIKTHPLLSQEPTLRNTIVFVEPRNMRYRYIDDTMFVSQKEELGRSSSGKRVDATIEEFLTEAGMEYHFPETIMILQNVGVDG